MSTTCSGNGMAFFPAAASFMLQTQPPQHGDTEIQDRHHGHHPSTASLTSLLPSYSPHHQDFHGTGGGDHHDVGQLPMLGKRSMSFPTGLEMCSSDHHHHHPHDYPGAAPNNGVGIGIGMGGGDEDLSEDDGSQLLGGGGGGIGEKKRRLSMEQVKTLEKNFELGNKLEPERKIQLAKALGLQPRQIAIWFQNRRARWKTKQLEKDYNILKRQFDALKSDNENLLSQNHKLQAQIMALKNGNREPTESINLNKENTTEGSASSNRSENSNSHHHHQHDHHIKSDISRSTPPTPPPTVDDLDQQHNNTQLLSAAALHPTSTTTRTSMPLFPPSSNSSSTGLLREINNENIIPHHLRLHMEAQQLSFHPSIMSNNSRPDHDDDLNDGHHQNKFDHHHHHHQSAATHHVKEENGTFSNMFVGMDDQSVFWPWLEQPN